jgi:hypothetical protein
LTRCLGREIDSAFREAFCGRKRLRKGFPCDECDLNSDTPEGKELLKKWGEKTE